MEEQKSMQKAYRIAQEMIDDRIKEKDPEIYSDMKEIREADVIVVKGNYDQIEEVLSISNTPFLLVSPEDMNDAQLRPDQVIFINCPGRLNGKGLRKIKGFVNEGGFLFTTDWALKHVLEEAFPGYVKYNEKETDDEVVRVELIEKEDPFLKSIIGPKDDPQWWLEKESYPIKILKKEKVTVLITSKEIEERYGESPVFITFEHGEGKVYHMISHFYLQRTETRTDRHSSKADNYLNEKEIPEYLRAKYASMGISESNVAEVESALTSSAMIRKIIVDKNQQMRRRKKNDK